MDQVFPASALLREAIAKCDAGRTLPSALHRAMHEISGDGWALGRATELVERELKVGVEQHGLPELRENESLDQYEARVSLAFVERRHVLGAAIIMNELPPVPAGISELGEISPVDDGRPVLMQARQVMELLSWYLHPVVADRAEAVAPRQLLSLMVARYCTPGESHLYTARPSDYGAYDDRAVGSSLLVWGFGREPDGHYWVLPAAPREPAALYLRVRERG